MAPLAQRKTKRAGDRLRALQGAVHGSAHVEEIPEGTPRAGRSLSVPFLKH